MGLHWPALAFVGFCEPALAFVGICEPALACIGFCWPSWAVAGLHMVVVVVGDVAGGGDSRHIVRTVVI